MMCPALKVAKKRLDVKLLPTMYTDVSALEDRPEGRGPHLHMTEMPHPDGCGAWM